MAMALPITFSFFLFTITAFFISTVHSQSVNDGCSLDPSDVLPPAYNASALTCVPVWNNFILRYSQSEDNILTIVLSTLYTLGWVGIGFSKDGMMTGSSAMVGWIGKTGIHHIEQFYLKGRSSKEVVVNEGRLSSTNNAPFVAVSKAQIYLAFQLNFSSPIKKQNLLFAFGTSIPVKNRLKEHSDKISITFDFSDGTKSASSYPYQLKRTHGILNIIGWGVVVPIGVIVARYCKQWDPIWFYIHGIIQLVGFLLGLAGVVAGVALYNKVHSNVSTHRGLGIFILVLGILQVIAFFLRPDKGSKTRKYWNWYHHLLGRLTLILAIANIFLGIRVGGADNSWKIAYTINIIILFTTAFILEIVLWTRSSRRSVDIPKY